MALPIFQRTVTNDSGDVINGAEVTVVDEATGLNATLFSDRAGTVPLTNPFFTGSDGLAQFYAAPGEYRITASGVAGAVTWRFSAMVGSSAFSDTNFIKDSDIHDTLAGATSRTDIQEGSSVRITDRGDGVFDYVTGETANGFNIINHDTLPLQLKLRVIDDIAYFPAWGAVGDDIAIDTLAIQAACNSGHSVLEGRSGDTYRCEALTISNSAVRAMTCSGRFTIKTIATASVIGLSITQRQYFKMGPVLFESSGSINDGLNTIGVDFQEGCSLIETEQGFQTLGYSIRGCRITQCVAVTMNNYSGVSGGYCLSFEKGLTDIPCTTVVLNQPYILGGLRGVWSEGTAGIMLHDPIFENCGSDISNDAALFIDGGTAHVENSHFEANARDIISVNANIQWVGNAFKSGATGADLYVYSVIPEADRAQGYMDYSILNIKKIDADTRASVDLVIGENLTIPVTGGSAQFGFNTTSKTTGVLSTNNAFETIATLTGQASATVSDKKTYRYVVYVGFADLPTGFNSGVIVDGVIYSDTGSVPVWLQMSGDNLQASATSLSYGLNWGLILNDTMPIGAP